MILRCDAKSGGYDVENLPNTGKNCRIGIK